MGKYRTMEKIIGKRSESYGTVKGNHLWMASNLGLRKLKSWRYHPGIQVDFPYRYWHRKWGTNQLGNGMEWPIFPTKMRLLGVYPYAWFSNTARWDHVGFINHQISYCIPSYPRISPYHVLSNPHLMNSSHVHSAPGVFSLLISPPFPSVMRVMKIWEIHHLYTWFSQPQSSINRCFHK